MSNAAAAVVTGAGTGIGRATALALGERGLSLFCVGRRVEPLRDTAQLLGESATVVPADISSAEGIAAVAAALDGRTVSVLVHAAASEGVVSVVDTDRAIFDRLIDTNLAGPFFLTRKLAPVLADGSAVVFVGSIAARHGRDRHAAYGASKAGLLGLTANLAVEMAPRVRVNCVEPGATDTAMFAQAVNDHLQGLDQQHIERAITAEQARMLLGKTGEPAEIAAAITYLALDASYNTGSVLTCDGGYSAR